MFGAENIRLGATDTDSFMYTIKCPNLDEVIWQNRQHFDLSNYPKDHPLYDPTNKKVLGLFKNELPAQLITERVNLRAKLYGFRLANGGPDTLRCKGIKKAVIKKTLNVDEYVKVLESQKSLLREQTMLRSYNHRIYTIKQQKVALSSYDDKRFILPNGVDTRAHGHWRNKY